MTFRGRPSRVLLMKNMVGPYRTLTLTLTLALTLALTLTLTLTLTSP